VDSFPHLRQPIELGGLRVRNRLMMPTHGPRLPQGRYLRYLEERARGGVGLIGFNLGPLGIMQFPLGPGQFHVAHGSDIDAVPPHPLTAEGRAFYDSQVPAYRAWGEIVRKHGARAIGQLYHSGAAQHTDTFQPAVAPSPVADEYERVVPHTLTGDEIADLIETFACGARRARDAGFDVVELHAAHGYLGYQFLSPLTNRRTDAYGGSLENRLRFLLDTLRATRDAIGGALPIGVRINGPDPVPGGLTLEDLVEACRRIAAEGVAYISISGGTYSGLRRGAHLPYVAPALIPPGPNVAAAAAVRAAVSVPVAVTGRIADLELAEKIVADGKADVIGMLRALIADPQAPAKAFSGQAARIIPCIACNECHYGRAVACSVNPAAGREAGMEIAPAAASQKILIVGAGPAGLECATAAARRGHRVILVDRKTEIGGTLASLARVSEHAEFGRYLRHAAETIRALPIELRLGIQADNRLVDDIAPDSLVLATGARYRTSAIISDKLRSLLTGEEALTDIDRLGRHVVVAGGLDDHLPPLVIADWIARSGRAVTLLTENIAPAPALEPANLYLFMKRLMERNVAIKPMTAAVALEAGTLTIRNSITNSIDRIAGVDSVVAVDGRLADDSLAQSLPARVPKIHVIGDALSPRRMLHATLDGARLGLAI
jgi:2,4-dienoyl-CoA reductase-like NADH-dependent reductase (Old Yellow Enzyme family)